MKQKTIARFLSLCIALSMIVGLCPTAFAATDMTGNQKNVEINDQPSINVSTNQVSNLAPGVTQNVVVAHNANNERVAYYAVTADINREDVNVYANYKDNQNEVLGMSKLTDQVAAAKAKHEGENYSVVAASNATFYNMTNGKPMGAFVMEGKDITENGDAYSFFAILKSGEAIIGHPGEYSKYKGQIQEAVGGATILVSNGEVNKNVDTVTRHPRSTVGLTEDGKVVMMVADGRQPSVSVGLSHYEQALIMQSLGCVEAIELDGGGSATYGCKPEGEDDFRIISSPSDGLEREISGSLMVVSTAVPSGEFDHAVLSAGSGYLTSGSSIKVEAKGVDAYGSPSELPADVTWKLSDSSYGSLENGVFTSSGKMGDVTVSLLYQDKVVGETVLHIVTPDAVSFEKDTLVSVFGETIPLNISATWKGVDVTINENDITFSLSNENIGTISGFSFTACDESVGIRQATITATLKNNPEVTAQAKIEVYRSDEAVFDFDNATGGNRQMAWNREVSNTTTEDGKIYSVVSPGEAIDISYAFGLDMKEIQVPSDIQSIWNILMGDKPVWDSLLGMAERIQPLTNVAVTVNFDPKLDVDVSGITVRSDFFTLESASYDEAAHKLTLICKWKTVAQPIPAETANPICILTGIKATVSSDTEWTDESINITCSGDVSYDVFARSGTAYSILQKLPSLKKYAYQQTDESGQVVQGIRIQQQYASFEDSFAIDRSKRTGWLEVDGNKYYYIDGVMQKGVTKLIDGIACTFDVDGVYKPDMKFNGWLHDNGNSYYCVDNIPLTGSHYLENGDGGYMYTFDENGVYLEDYFYTGFYQNQGGWMYFRLNEPMNGWLYIDGEWYYFMENKYAPTSPIMIDGLLYDFAEKGKVIGAWREMDEGTRFYFCRTYYKNTWAEIYGEKYYFDGNGYRAEGKRALSLLGEYLGAYEFTQDGKFVENITGVFQDAQNGNYYYAIDGVLQNNGLFKYNGDIYYARSNYQLATTPWYVPEDATNGIMPAGTYEFGPDGKMVTLNGIVNVGGNLYYYIDGEQQFGSGLIELNGDYYYVRSNGLVATTPWYVSEEAAHGLVPAGTYEFGPDGKMVRLDGIVELNGNLYYYINGEQQFGSGLIEIDGDYYYVRSNGLVATTAWYVPADATNGLMPAGTYEFGADGKMIRKDGIVTVDGKLYYYVNGEMQFGLGLIEIDGDYYYIRSNGLVATTAWYVPEDATNGLMPAGTYEFGADGKMIRNF